MKDKVLTFGIDRFILAIFNKTAFSFGENAEYFWLHFTSVKWNIEILVRSEFYIPLSYCLVAFDFLYTDVSKFIYASLTHDDHVSPLIYWIAFSNDLFK